MEEPTAKRTEIAGVVAAAGLSAVPIIGGPLSVVIQYVASIPMQKRTEAILREIRSDIVRLFDAISDLDVELLHSEEFMAALFRVVRAAQESPSSEKRTALRNALLNGYLRGQVPQQRDLFLGLVDKYDPGHLAILECIRKLMVGRDRMLDYAVSAVEGSLGDVGKEMPVRSYIRDLVNDGLVAETADREVREESGAPNMWGPPTTRQVVREQQFHSVSPRGREFLTFVADPLEGCSGAGGEGAPEARS